MRPVLHDGLLGVQIIILGAIAAAGRRIQEAARRPFLCERGQTPTEYLMIVGLMAVVIVTVFVFYYWSNVQSSAQSWVSNVKSSIMGSQITK